MARGKLIRLSQKSQRAKHKTVEDLLLEALKMVRERKKSKPITKCHLILVSEPPGEDFDFLRLQSGMETAESHWWMDCVKRMNFDNNLEK